MIDQIKKRLLAVDDNLSLAELIVRVASRCGYEGRPLDHSYLLPQTLREWRPDVLTLDLSMPEEDGMSVFSILEDMHFTGQIVIISGQEGWLRKSACRLAAGRRLNVAGDMEKPVDLAALSEVLSRVRDTAEA